MDQLSETTQQRRKIQSPDLADIALFLNSKIDPMERSIRDVKSLWSDARHSLALVSLQADFSPNLLDLSI